MRNIFLIYMPPSNLEAMAHYEDTIKRRVPLERVRSFLSRNDVAQLSGMFGGRPLAIWGSRNSTKNRATFERMSLGDDLLIVEGDTIRFMGKIALKTINPGLSRDLWKPLQKAEIEGWDLIYFIANPCELDVAFAQFAQLVGFERGFRLQGFIGLARERVQSFYAAYDDLYSVLLRIQQGRPVRQLDAADADLRNTSQETPIVPPPPSEELPRPEMSDHVAMQIKLANLGLKAGDKIWVPNGDQSRLRSHGFTEFEPTFAAGIDVVGKYVENIDVVWKEEFRIKAAFEVENSTAIYSGLLRFADLNVVAPNTIYPMFIVAPAERRNRVREQLERPIFQRLDLKEKVRFLPYEAVNEIDRFFASASSGLSVDLIQGRAESFV